MDSTPNNPNPWAPYNTYKDCSPGICSIYCPQWCYVVFPPPPPDDYSGDGSGGTYFSPLVIAVIGILASAFLLVTYYMLVTKYCRRQRWQDRDDHNLVSDIAVSAGDDHNGTSRSSTTGLDESIIKSITVYKYQRLEGLVDGTDCSVCLCEFVENESLRLLPKCNHAFHVPCIDKWLKSHSSCPLCRSNIATLGDLPPPQPSRVAPYQPAPPTTTISINTSSLARCNHQTADSPMLVIQDYQRLQVPVESRSTGQDAGIMRRSVSLNSTICGHVIATASTSDHRGHIENLNLLFSIGIETPGLPDGTELNNPIGTNDSVSASSMEMKRSTSTGRFMLGRCGGGQVRNWVLPR